MRQRSPADKPHQDLELTPQSAIRWPQASAAYLTAAGLLPDCTESTPHAPTRHGAHNAKASGKGAKAAVAFFAKLLNFLSSTETGGREENSSNGNARLDCPKNSKAVQLERLLCCGARFLRMALLYLFAPALLLAAMRWVPSRQDVSLGHVCTPGSGLLDTLIQLLYLILQLLHLQASSKKALQILMLECSNIEKNHACALARASN